METGSHAHHEDPRNETVRIYVNGRIVPRAEAVVSVFDSGFLLGDGVWEGIRLHNNKLAFLEEHLDRLYEGAKAIDLDIGMAPAELAKKIMDTCAANGMHSGVHIRLVVSRGLKSTPYQSPKANVGGATVVIIPEWKEAHPTAKERPMSLFTAHVRRGAPDVQDPMWNSLSKLNCIAACIQADKAGADEALMLDPHGFVATCNSTHFFIVRKGELWTSTGKYCLKGITRGNIIELAHRNAVPVYQKDFSLTEVYGAEEAFVTGTFAGVMPVGTVDGRQIGDGGRGQMTARLQSLYADLIQQECPAD
ncbi:aminotransferase class IV [Hwanghaeella grinnelliae]|uniref:Probable branched-chain-amino-acid aminotransferase n=2 Tax=Hwanghaeella grinnelliae TaxID=2500179 RepID=A0A437QZF1_9PROT|nr:aminotransferase class IV [Hwanghaeella grinnelliae]